MSILDNETWKNVMRNEEYRQKGTEANFAMEDFLVEGDLGHLKKFNTLDKEISQICEREAVSPEA